MDITMVHALTGAFAGAGIGTLAGVVLLDESRLDEWVERVTKQPCATLFSSIFLGAALGTGCGAYMAPEHNNTPATILTAVNQAAIK